MIALTNETNGLNQNHKKDEEGFHIYGCCRCAVAPCNKHDSTDYG